MLGPQLTYSIGLMPWLIWSRVNESYKLMDQSFQIHTEISGIEQLSSMNYRDKQLLDRISELYFRREADENIKKMLEEVAGVFQFVCLGRHTITQFRLFGSCTLPWIDELPQNLLYLHFQNYQFYDNVRVLLLGYYNRGWFRRIDFSLANACPPWPYKVWLLIIFLGVDFRPSPSKNQKNALMFVSGIVVSDSGKA